MFNTVGVTADKQSPLCCIISSPTNLWDKFIAYLPITIYFGDASVTAETSNRSDETCDATAASPNAIVIEWVRIFEDEMMRYGANSNEYSYGDDIEVVSNCDDIQVVSPSPIYNTMSVLYA